MLGFVQWRVSQSGDNWQIRNVATNKYLGAHGYTPPGTPVKCFDTVFAWGMAPDEQRGAHWFVLVPLPAFLSSFTMTPSLTSAFSPPLPGYLLLVPMTFWI